MVSTKEIKKGELLSKDNIWVKRPGTGDIPAEEYNALLGKVATKNIGYDEHLSWSDFE